jgi:hypothetical protein
MVEISMEKVVEDPSTYHYKFYQEMWPEICSKDRYNNFGGVDLPRLNPHGFDVEIKTTETHTFLLWDKDFAVADYFLCYDLLINTHFIVEKRSLPPVQKKCRSYRLTQIKKSGIYLPKPLDLVKEIVNQIRVGDLSYINNKK